MRNSGRRAWFDLLDWSPIECVEFFESRPGSQSISTGLPSMRVGLPWSKFNFDFILFCQFYLNAMTFAVLPKQGYLKLEVAWYQKTTLHGHILTPVITQLSTW